VSIDYHLNREQLIAIMSITLAIDCEHCLSLRVRSLEMIDKRENRQIHIHSSNVVYDEFYMNISSYQSI
jgi:hypothetical protein